MGKAFMAAKRLNELVLGIREQTDFVRNCQTIDDVNECLSTINDLIDEIRITGDTIEAEAARVETKRKSRVRQRAILLADAFDRIDLNDRDPISDLSELDAFIEDLDQLQTQIERLNV